MHLVRMPPERLSEEHFGHLHLGGDLGADQGHAGETTVYLSADLEYFGLLQEVLVEVTVKRAI